MGKGGVGGWDVWDGWIERTVGLVFECMGGIGVVVLGLAWLWDGWNGLDLCKGWHGISYGSALAFGACFVWHCTGVESDCVHAVRYVHTWNGVYSCAVCRVCSDEWMGMECTSDE